MNDETFLEYLRSTKTRAEIVSSNKAFRTVVAEAIYEHDVSPVALSAALEGAWFPAQIADWLIEKDLPEASERLAVIDAIIQLLV